jgi:myo-inositol 2-dehydrogenase/D-chiro-inositol 1-dehydrogenase
MQTEKILKVGFVGCGGHAQGCNIPVVAQNPNLKIRAFCDLNIEVLEALKDEYSPDYITQYFEKIFADPEIDMVVCATKPDFRMPVMEAAVKYRKPLFVEKPLAYTREDVYKMVRLMQPSGVPFMVGFNRPYSLMMQAIRPIYRRHQKGNTLISYRIVGEAAVWPPEHREAVCEKKESTVIHETTHIFDLLNWLTGLEPEKVYMAGSGHIDNIIVLTYPDDIIATIVAGDNGSVGFPKERMEIDTNCGTIAGEFFTEMIVAGMGEDSGIKTFEYTFNGKKYNDGATACRDKWLKWRRELTEEKRLIGHFSGQVPAVNKGHYEQHEYFRKQIISGKPVETDVVRGAAATLIAWEAIKSWETGNAVELDFSKLFRHEKVLDAII